jgi:hypothetical protein
VRRRWVWLGLLACVTAVIVACVKTLWARQSRLSGAVALVRQSPGARAFLTEPGVGYLEAYFRFGTDMPDDVIIAIDQEMIEGVNRSLRYAGADWMALVGVQRAGGVWVTAGTDATMNGTPSTARNWKIYDLKTRLLPDTWYRMRVEADFGNRHFRSFSIDGGDLSRTIDLSQLTLDYPNYMPFSAPSLGYFVVAMRSHDMMHQRGTPLVYFDDVEGGSIAPDGTEHQLFSDGFETQQSVTRQPLSTPVINLDAYSDGRWYLERDESLFTIQKVPFAHSGSAVAVADVNLE